MEKVRRLASYFGHLMRRVDSLEKILMLGGVGGRRRRRRQRMRWLDGITDSMDVLLCLQGVPDLPVAPQDEAGLTKTFQTWPRGWFHIP